MPSGAIPNPKVEVPATGMETVEGGTKASGIVVVTTGAADVAAGVLEGADVDIATDTEVSGTTTRALDEAVPGAGMFRTGAGADGIATGFDTTGETCVETGGSVTAGIGVANSSTTNVT